MIVFLLAHERSFAMISPPARNFLIAERLLTATAADWGNDSTFSMQFLTFIRIGSDAVSIACTFFPTQLGIDQARLRAQRSKRGSTNMDFIHTSRVTLTQRLSRNVINSVLIFTSISPESKIFSRKYYLASWFEPGCNWLYKAFGICVTIPVYKLSDSNLARILSKFLVRQPAPAIDSILRPTRQFLPSLPSSRRKRG